MITIVMAVYNGQEYIGQQLESIKRQTRTDWRLIIRDDGSSDDTVNLIRQFADTVSQSVTLYFNHPPSGSAKKNFGLLLLDAVKENAEYVMCCDQDDIWLPDKVECSIKKMQELEKAWGKNVPLLVHTDLEIVDANLKTKAPSLFQLSHIPVRPSLSQIIIQNHVTGCTMILNNKLLQAVAEEAGNEGVIMHDYWAALYAAVFGKIDVIEESFILYRQHEDNSVGAKDNNNHNYLWKRLLDGKENYQRAMDASRRQIQRFLDCYADQMKEEGKRAQYCLMKEYAALSDKKQRSRITFYWKNHVWKKGFIRKIMQCLWG